MSTDTSNHRLQTLNFVILNRMKQRQRARNGKPAVIHDSSMDKRYRQRTQSQIDRDTLEVSAFGVRLGDNSFRQLTDQENDQVRVNFTSRNLNFSQTDVALYLVHLCVLGERILFTGFMEHNWVLWAFHYWVYDM